MRKLFNILLSTHLLAGFAHAPLAVSRKYIGRSRLATHDASIIERAFSVTLHSMLLSDNTEVESFPHSATLNYEAHIS